MARCEDVRQEAGDIKVFTLRMHNAPQAIMEAVRPGGHVAISCADIAGARQCRLYSVTRKDAPDLFEIAVKRSGRHSMSDHMHGVIQPGSSVGFEYAAGDVTVESVAGYERVAMIAGGIGITVPIALIRELEARSRSGMAVPEVMLMLCIPRLCEMAFLHELLALDLTSRWFSLRVFVTRETVRQSEHFSTGRPDPQSLAALGQPQAVVICGSHAFAHALREQVGQRWPTATLLVESFTPPVVPALMPENEGGRPAVRLRIVGSGQVLEFAPGKSLLDMLGSANIPVRSQCRSGICGSCRIRISGGECRLEPDFCLSDKDRRCGHVLSCCTFPLAGEIDIHLNQPL
jgi:ferredoxin-NADP reductase